MIILLIFVSVVLTLATVGPLAQCLYLFPGAKLRGFQFLRPPDIEFSGILPSTATNSVCIINV